MVKYLMAAKAEADKARDAHGMLHGSSGNVYASSGGRGSPLIFKGSRSPLSGGPGPGGSPSPLMMPMGGVSGGRGSPGRGGGNGIVTGIAGAGDAMEFVPNGQGGRGGGAGGRGGGGGSSPSKSSVLYGDAARSPLLPSPPPPTRAEREHTLLM